jgi:molybdenum cofactor cytidylyltransferase
MLHGAAIILAAGASRRMGRPKALLPWENTTFLGHAAARMEALALHHRILVTSPELASQTLLPGWNQVINPDPDRGMLSSLQLAIAHQPDVDFALISLVDQPLIRVDTFRLMLDAAAATDWATPSYQGRAGHPVAIGSACFALLLSAPPQGSPRDLLRRIPRRFIVCDDPGILHDVDTPADLTKYP